MPNDLLNTEDRIFEAAKNIFLLYGYHGTRLQQISDTAGIHQSAIHYYYRSKDRLYAKVVKFVIDNILKTEMNLVDDLEIFRGQKWFLITEMYNNQNCFENVLKELYALEWFEKLNGLKKILEIK